MFPRFCAQTFQITDSGINWEVADKPNKSKNDGRSEFSVAEHKTKTRGSVLLAAVTMNVVTDVSPKPNLWKK